MYEALALLAVFVLIYSSVGGGVERTPISGPIVFIAFGLFVGPLGLGLLSLGVDHETIRCCQLNENSTLSTQFV